MLCQYAVSTALRTIRVSGHLRPFLVKASIRQRVALKPTRRTDRAGHRVGSTRPPVGSARVGRPLKSFIVNFESMRYTKLCTSQFISAN